MPNEHLAAYDAHRARLDALEPAYLGKVRRALIRSAERAAEAALQGASPATAAAYVDAKPVLLVLQALYVAAGVPEARATYALLTEGQKAAAPPQLATTWAERLRRFLTGEGAAAIQGITRRTRAIVRAALQEAADTGDSVAVAAKKLRARVAELSQERAVSIVRTELLSSANYASTLGAQATGLRLEKFWISTPGPRTRETHRAAGGQGAPLQDGFFTVGGERCRYPGDPMLSAGERVRCRCSLGYRRPNS